MVEVLITGSVVIVNENEIIKDGYVFIRNGILEDFGQQPPPEDYTYASLILGGEGRIVAPGLTAVASPISYPFRFLRPSLKRRVELLKRLSPSEAALLSLAGVYELHMSGVTTIVAEGISYEYISRLKELAGGRYGLAFPSCEGRPPESPEWSVGSLLIADESCEGSWDVRMRDDIWESSFGSEALVLINRPSCSLSGMRGIVEKSNVIRRILGLSNLELRKRALAEVAIYNVRRPPAMFLDMAPKDYLKDVYSSGAKVETLVVGEEVLVDGGEHLYIVEKHFNEIRKVVLRLLGSGS